MKTGTYCGQQFEVAQRGEQSGSGGIFVNGVLAQVEPGKKEGTFALRETPQMYGARLMVDIAERPEFYFARKEIARTTDDLERFEKELANIYFAIRNMERTDTWFRNEQQCDATFKCEFCNLCYNNVTITDEVPEGYKSLFTKERAHGDDTAETTATQ
jgi:hypothetical protein